MTEHDAAAELAQIAAADPAFRRFGAAAHRYQLEPPIDLSARAAARHEALRAFAAANPRTAALPVSEQYFIDALPDDYRAFVATVGAGGAGPYYGLISATSAVAHQVFGAWGNGIPIGHLGCGYMAVLALEDGSVWLAARAIGVVKPIRASFTEYYVTWLAQLAANEPPEAFVQPGVCPLPIALGGYLGMCEQRLGLASGTIAGDALADALAQLPAGGIEIAADDAEPLFHAGDRVDPCVACAILLDNLGLPRQTVAPGHTPRL